MTSKVNNAHCELQGGGLANSLHNCHRGPMGLDLSSGTMKNLKSVLAQKMNETDRFYAEVGTLVRKARSDQSVTQEDLGNAVTLT
jgi:hypothetical protein